MKPFFAEFEVRLARDAADLRAAQALRYEVFVAELGGDGPLVDHAARLERDRFDEVADHLLLIDPARADRPVVGVYRLMRAEQAAAAGGFYTAEEYDIGPLMRSGRRLLELGRSCLHRDYRGGTAMVHLWNGLADHVARHGVEVLLGTASFHGTGVTALRQPLSFLHHRHLAPPELRVRAVAEHFQAMNLLPAAQVDRLSALRQMPALIKAYLRLGGTVGEGAFVDQAFNTTDVCLVMDIERMNETRCALYARAGHGA